MEHIPCNITTKFWGTYRDSEIYQMAFSGHVTVQNNPVLVADTAGILAEHNSKYSVARN